MRHPFALQNSLFPMVWERKTSAFYPSLTTQIATTRPYTTHQVQKCQAQLLNSGDRGITQGRILTGNNIKEDLRFNAHRSVED